MLFNLAACNFEESVEVSDIVIDEINAKRGNLLHSLDKLYYFAHFDIITNVSTYGDTKVVGYVCGNEKNGNETVYNTFTINTKTGKVSGLKDRLLF